MIQITCKPQYFKPISNHFLSKLSDGSIAESDELYDEELDRSKNKNWAKNPHRATPEEQSNPHLFKTN